MRHPFFDADEKEHPFNRERLEPVTVYPYVSMKPDGLWYSAHSEAGDTWEDWCESEEPGWLGGKVYELEIDESKILRLGTIRSIIAFNNGFKASRHEINWHAAAERWSGIEIVPYRQSWHLRCEMAWYYGWDCASGCIWDMNALLSFREVETV